MAKTERTALVSDTPDVEEYDFLCQEGYYCPALPPCVDGKFDKYCAFACNKACGTETCCISIVDQNPFCYFFGEVPLNCWKGLGIFFDKWRGPLMMTMAVLSFLQLWVCVYAACALARDPAVLQNTYWAGATVKSTTTSKEVYKIFVGIERVAFKDLADDSLEIRTWDETCANSGNGNTESSENEFCHDCESAATPLTATVIATTISKVGQLMTDLQRSTRAGDVNCQKFIGVFTGFVSTILSLSAFQLFADSCWAKRDALQVPGHEITFHEGPGFIAMVIMTILAFPDGIMHLLTPVPPTVSRISPAGFPESRRKLNMSNKGPLEFPGATKPGEADNL